MASDRPGSSACLLAHASIADFISSGIRKAVSGSRPPVKGRPRFFGLTVLTRVMGCGITAITDERKHHLK